MGERLSLNVDATDAERTIDNLNLKIEDTEAKLAQMGDDVSTETAKSFSEVLGMMQASYMMVSGIAQIVGGNMSQIFSSMFSIAVSAIGVYGAIAEAMAATGPVGWVQAGIMTASLVTAIVQLSLLMTKQTELSRRISGINMGLHGISSLIRNYTL